MNKIDTCILMCSCDKYSDIWPIFFRFLQDSWADCPYPIYLNTETKQYQDSYFNVTTLNDKRKNSTWTKRLLGCIKRIKCNNIIIILDDFFFLEKISNKAFNECIEFMNNDKYVGLLSFKQQKKTRFSTCEHINGFVKRRIGDYYIVNLLPGIWKKKCLLKLLSPYEDPWQFEWFGTERSKFTKYKFYERHCTEENILKFDLAKYGLFRGKWQTGNVALFKERGIEVDFSKRGFLKDEAEANYFFPVPRRQLRDRIRYFIYGGVLPEETGDGTLRIPIKSQIKLALTKPKFFCKMLKRKFRYLFELDKNTKVDTYV